MKKVFVIIGIIASTIVMAAVIGGYILYQKPGGKFLLIMSDVVPPTGVTQIEKTIRLNNNDIPMTVFSCKNTGPGKYYFLLHGLTPESYKHPSIIKMANALCIATGRTVFIPLIRGSIEGGRSINEVTTEIKNIYLKLKELYPGRYNAFGSCIGGTGLLISFNKMPAEQYPDKLFLYGPFFTGKILVDFYNRAGVEEIDYLVKMASALNSGEFRSKEKKLISKAIVASKPGRTDRDEMRAILGDKLFKRVDESKVDHRELLQLNEFSLLTKGKKGPESDFYIIHSTSDDIIPYSMGLMLHKFLIRCGLHSKFLGTSLFGHTQTKRTLDTYRRELPELIGFLDELFQEKDGR